MSKKDLTHFFVSAFDFPKAPVLIKGLVLKPEALRLDVSASDAAMTLGIAPALAKEHLIIAETK
ncbi:hypothetical protein MKX03_017642, partial [Papaver bracteatum]